MNALHSPDRSPHSTSFVAEESCSCIPDASDASEKNHPSHPNALPRRIEVSGEREEELQTFFVLSEDELYTLLAVARQCKAQAKLVADSLLQHGPDHITEANAAYGLERQMAELQESVRNLMK